MRLPLPHPLPNRCSDARSAPTRRTSSANPASFSMPTTRDVTGQRSPRGVADRLQILFQGGTKFVRLVITSLQEIKRQQGQHAVDGAEIQPGITKQTQQTCSKRADCFAASPDDNCNSVAPFFRRPPRFHGTRFKVADLHRSAIIRLRQRADMGPDCSASGTGDVSEAEDCNADTSIGVTRQGLIDRLAHRSSLATAHRGSSPQVDSFGTCRCTRQRSPPYWHTNAKQPCRQVSRGRAASSVKRKTGIQPENHHALRAPRTPVAAACPNHASPEHRYPQPRPLLYPRTATRCPEKSASMPSKQRAE